MLRIIIVLFGLVCLCSTQDLVDTRERWKGTIFEASGGDGCGVNEELVDGICVCQSGFVNVSGVCEKEYCSTGVPCNGHGQCTQNGVNYNCTCFVGWSGPECDTKDFCSEVNPCNGHGTCSSGACDCDASWYGERCSLPGGCQSNPCLNEGSCVDVNQTTFQCNCTQGYTGDTCASYDDCASALPCSGHGICINATEGGKTCQCDEHYTGHRCENYVAGACESQPCGDHGTCMEINEGSYECTCQEGYTGVHCQILDLCEADSCNGHGVCSTVDNARYECNCDEGWQGDLCTYVDYCYSELACNGQTCVSSGMDFKCTCLGSYLGKTCDIPVCGGITELLSTGDTAIFETTFTQSSAQSNIKCPTGSIYGGISRASKQCLLDGGHGTWGAMSEIDCAAPVEGLPPTQQADSIAVITSDSSLSPSLTESSINTLANISKTPNMDDRTATNIIVSVDNLLTPGRLSAATVQQQRQQILDIVSQTQQNLNSSDFKATKKQLGVAAVKQTVTTFANDVMNCSFGFTKVIYKGDGFSGVVFEQMCNNPTNVIMSNQAVIKGDGDVSFQAYPDDLLFHIANSTNDINSIVFYLGGNMASSYEMKFQLFKRYEMNDAGESPADNVTATCVRWGGTSWKAEGTFKLLSSDSLNNYVQCTGTQAGYYAVEMIPKDTAIPITPPGSGGLTDAEIAGIVVGSVAGVVILAGLGYYCYSKSNKKTNKVTSLKSGDTSRTSSPNPPQQVPQENIEMLEEEI